MHSSAKDNSRGGRVRHQDTLNKDFLTVPMPSGWSRHLSWRLPRCFCISGLVAFMLWAFLVLCFPTTLESWTGLQSVILPQNFSDARLNWANSANLTIVIPSFQGHFHQLAVLLGSMRQKCLDCHLYPIHVILGEKDLQVVRDKNLTLFQDTSMANGQFLNITLKTLTEVYPRIVAQNFTEDAFARISKYNYQSWKKLYGCIAAKTHWCWMLDSEGYWLREGTVREVTWSVVEAKSHYVDFDRNTTQEPWMENPKRDLLGLPLTGKYGWALEHYLWVWENPILEEVATIMDQRNITVWKPPSKLIFIENMIASYMQHYNDRYHYNWIATSTLFNNSEDYHHYSDYFRKHKQPMSPLEWTSVRLSSADPRSVAIITDVWRRAGLTIYRSSDNVKSTDFLLAVPNVILMVSNWSPSVIEAFSIGEDALRLQRAQALSSSKQKDKL